MSGIGIRDLSNSTALGARAAYDTIAPQAIADAARLDQQMIDVFNKSMSEKKALMDADLFTSTMAITDKILGASLGLLKPH